MHSTRGFKVLHAADSETGGGAEQVFRQTVSLTSALPGVSVETYVSDGERSPASYVFSLRHYRGFRDRIECFEPDVIHLQNYYHYLSPSVLLAVRSARRRGWSGRCLMTAHDYHLAYPNSGMQRVVDGHLVNVAPSDVRRRGVLRRYDERSVVHGFLKWVQFTLAYVVLRLGKELDCVVTPSNFVAEVLRASGVSDVRVIRNPLAQEFAVARGSRLEGRIAMVGRLVPEKGFVEAVVAIDRLAGNGALPAGLSIDIYGAGELADELASVAQECSHVEVRLRGLLPPADLAQDLARATLLIAPSRWYEVSPLVLVEAAVLGLPVVTPDHGGVAETARLSTRSYCYELTSEGSFAAAVRSALASGPDNDLKDAAAFTPDAYVAALMDAYGVGHA